MLEAVSPQDVGVDAQVETKCDALLRGALKDGVFPGAVLLCLRHGKIFMHKIYGYAVVLPYKKDK